MRKLVDVLIENTRIVLIGGMIIVGVGAISSIFCFKYQLAMERDIRKHNSIVTNFLGECFTDPKNKLLCVMDIEGFDEKKQVELSNVRFKMLSDTNETQILNFAQITKLRDMEKD
ncbi:hypothetical protein [Thermoactinomyces sp. DSM 45892]|uniref:hypothetical protein n=1 Tax=Thermoactinomyces sp. DSM 45892 TaxID=1882753 RepID=UPI00089AD3DC|nr:hypothetical protein [Thermoactinomyces sp. DSM 45892]SDY88381.1 hypothetical protein SAMN05444416_109164 [Thermoactinomyces sp. DSM 45892]